MVSVARDRRWTRNVPSRVPDRESSELHKAVVVSLVNRWIEACGGRSPDGGLVRRRDAGVAVRGW
ncbi:hypothetical protein Drose_30150 [Dactylosporangium roseum]|uniref:Uncharacterized protein n=1 Tax=Dactylosporangium roseum TaxID=47989 RepID=A0ABY5Z042_9ACTN|nr:hypothetical protein [Dactylosporangium roseum]UWZ35363.1 hypothetical protein Drose_30150 [Dactylosporangium roseum]